MGYIHIEIETSQSPKRPGNPSGDVIAFEHTTAATTMIVSDGLGSGIKAHIAAQMCVSRLMELMRRGYSMRRAFQSLVSTMEDAIKKDMPYAVFTVVRTLPDGVTSILSYEMPPPIFVTRRYANVLAHRTLTLGNSLISEANCHLEPGEGIIICSDGITQAGLGNGYANGWEADGVCQYMTDCLSGGTVLSDLPKTVVTKAREIWGKKQGDDCSVALARCRRGKIVNILTGPPRSSKDDKAVVKRFMLMEGTKVVSGGTTSAIVARCLGKTLEVEQNPQSMLAPPRYGIEGIDLVCEGAVTLNQVYNVMDEDPDTFEEESGVTELHSLLMGADRVNILIGSAINPATMDISFRQKGIITRQGIIPLICEKLKAAGKLAVVESV